MLVDFAVCSTMFAVLSRHLNDANEDEHRDESEDNEGELPAEHKSDDDGAGESHEGFAEHPEADTGHGLHEGRIGGQATGQAAGLVLALIVPTDLL